MNNTSLFSKLKIEKLKLFLSSWVVLLNNFIHRHIPPSIVVSFIIGTAALFLVYHLPFYKIPNLDFFQYVNDAASYMEFKLPHNIHAPPANPILIGVTSRLLSIPELLTAKIINLASVVLLNVIVWLTARNKFKEYSLIFLLLFISNPLHYLLGINISSEVLFAMVSGLIFFLYQDKKQNLAILLAGFAYLVRYEALAMLLAFIVAENGFPLQIQNLHKKKTNLYILVSLVIVFLWTSIVFLHNFSNKVAFGNTFVYEIVNWKGNLPQLDIVANLDLLVLWHSFPTTDEVRLGVVVVIMVMTLGLKYQLFKQRQKELIFLAFYILFYSAMHIVFPFFIDRYLYPLLFPVLFLLFSITFSAVKDKKKDTYLGMVFLLITVFFNISQVKEALKQTTYYEYDKFIVVEWLRNNTDIGTKYVLTYQPWVVEYYIPGEQFHVLNSYEYEHCRTITCIVEILGVNEIIVTRSKTAKKNYEADGAYLSSYHHTIPFEIPDSELELLDIVEEGSEKVEFYKYSVSD